MAALEAKFDEMLKLLEFICTLQSAMEQRTCDAGSEGADCSRMLEQWSRGRHANVHPSAITVLKNKIFET